jgi:hypothetical protein
MIQLQKMEIKKNMAVLRQACHRLGAQRQLRRGPSVYLLISGFLEVMTM